MGFTLPTKEEFALIEGLAEHAGKAGHYDRLMKGGGKGTLLLLMLTARELDIAPMQALNGGLFNIDGKIEMSTHLMNAKIRQAGHSLSIEFGSDDKMGTYCRITGKRRDNGDTMAITYSTAHATQAGLAGRDIWKKYPREMCYARALGRVARMLFGDVIGGAYAEGEIQEEETPSLGVVEEVCEPISVVKPQPEEGPSEFVEINPEKLQSFVNTRWVEICGGDISVAEKRRCVDPEVFWKEYNKFAKETLNA